ncbi:DRTGG domain-containing protein [Caldalkalibacillus horti]|uniref:Transcriptional regulator n=1 Tax=Caldalkalibacillus horti TaxID=77523 RepID=A0ABT9W574_9BACI|nr:DRTGG domain-containing protein [Bacillus horti]MDQ0167985.1 putative transcriptional regulator [Bacillus horti]
MTKHELIISHIQSLEVGSKISVRQVAKELQVSEGTAYRAIKDAEVKGLVSTIGRVGTIRIEKKHKENIEKLTFAEVVNIVDGTVVGGQKGLHKSLHKFVIGAMELEEMMKYVDKGSLLIVGNRKKAHQLSLQHGAAVLITGGFEPTSEVKKLADTLELPVISSSYDSFTVAALINRAIYDRLIKKEIVMVEDILISITNTHYLYTTSKLADWYQLSEETKHSRYPVVDHKLRIKGMVTSKDILGHPTIILVDKVMTKDPLCVTMKTSVASAAHMMVWEGIELLPVVNDQKVLLGIISRQDVLKALQYTQKQPQMGQTYESLITGHFEEFDEEDDFYIRGDVTPQMINDVGTLSSGALTTIMTEAGHRAIRRGKRGDLVVENLSLYFFKPVQIEQVIEVHPRLLEVSRKFGKVDIEVFHEGTVIAKGIMTAQLIDR